MTRCCFIFFILLTFAGFSCKRYETNVWGEVKDGSTGSSIGGATVYLLETKNSCFTCSGSTIQRTVTGSSGVFYFDFTAHDGYSMVPFYKIEKIKIWRQNKFWRSAGIGVACGAGLGALLGFGSGDDTGNNGFVVFTAGQKAVMVGILGSLGGLVIGSIIGCTRRIIFIHRNLAAFSKN